MIVKKLFYLTLILILIEGIIRKWVYDSSIVYMFKYIPILFLWFIVLISKKYKFLKNDYPYYKLLILFIFFMLLNVFYSYFGIIVWFVGLLAYLGFLIFIFIIPSIFKNNIDIYDFIDLMIYISFPIFILGAIQFFLPPGHFLNVYAGDMLNEIATTGGFVRVTSIFNYLSIYSTYLSFVIPLIFVRIVYLRGVKRNFFIGLLLLGFFDIFATGSRGPVAFTFLSIILTILFIMIYASRKTRKEVLIYGGIFFTFLLIILFTNIIEFKSLDTLLDRTRTVGESEIFNRLYDLFTTPFRYALIAGMSGFGIGSAHQITNALGYNLNNSFHVPYEEPLERFVLEMGVFGTILFLVLLFWIMVDILKRIYSIKNKQNKILAFTLFVTLLQYFTFINNIVYNWIGAVHFFLSIGLIIAIKKIDNLEYQK